MPPRARRSLELIPNEIARKMTFWKRKKSIYKKVDELSKLCDIDVCLIIKVFKQGMGCFVKNLTREKEKLSSSGSCQKNRSEKKMNISRLPSNPRLSIFRPINGPHEDVDQKFENLYPTCDDRIDEFS
ncbi:unnamed protein product [Prunus brigantina]